MSKILIIEDDKEIIETLKELLTLEGYDVVSANSGKEGIKAAMRHHPDLIICDIMMPEMDGYEVIKTLQHNQSTFNIPFLFLTAKTAKSDLRFGMELGADDYITKPYEDNDILNAIEARLKKKKEVDSYFDKQLDSLHSYIASSLPSKLRHPLNTIIGYSQILKNKYGEMEEKEAQDMLDSVLFAGKRLLELIINYTYYTTLLDLGLSGGKYPSESTQHSQTVIYNGALDNAIKYNRQKDLKLVLEDSALNISDSHLHKIVSELSDNAFKYSAAGTDVSIKSFIQDNYYFIKFINEGKGFSKDQISKIAPFIQFGLTDLEKTGSGLGLSIVKKIVDIYHGVFDIDSQSYGHTTITIALPLETTEE